MFKNKSLQVKVVNDNAVDAATLTTQIDPEEIVRHTRAIFKDAAKGVALAVVAYVAADTVRQIAVNNTNPANRK